MASVAVRAAHILARLSGKPLAARILLREYLPFAGWLLTWTLIGLAVGHADAVRLLAANALVQAVRALCGLEVSWTLAQRIGSQPAILSASRRAAWRIDLLTILAMAGLLSGLILLLDLRAMDKAAAMLAVVGLSLIARHPGQLLIATRIRNFYWRLGAAVVGCIGAALVFGLELGWFAAAAVLALRDWGGLVATLLFGAGRGPPPLASSDPLSFAGTAARTERVAHRRLTYRISKGLLAMLLGPVGGFAARTGRGAGLDTRLAKFVPRNRNGIAALVLAMTAVSSVAFSLSREPAALLLAAAALRVAASAGSILLWWKYAQAVPEADEDDEDD